MTDRNSFAELGRSLGTSLRIIFNSKPLMAVFSALIAAITAFYTYLEGWDAGIARSADLRMLTKTVESQAQTIKAQGEHATKLDDELRVLTKAQHDRAEAEAARDARQIESDRERDYKVWLAVVLTNAPKNKSDAYSKAYKNHVGQGRDPEVAAYMTLGWGSVR